MEQGAEEAPKTCIVQASPVEEAPAERDVEERDAGAEGGDRPDGDGNAAVGARLGERRDATSSEAMFCLASACR